MTVNELFDSLNGVRANGSQKWMARCPGHADKSPSLSIREGEDGRILLHCFSGCSAKQITSALGLRVRDLFTDARPTGNRRRTPRPVRLDRIALAFRFELAALDRRLRAERVLTATRQYDCLALTDETRDRLMGLVASAHRDRERAELMEHVADTLRWKAYGGKRIADAA